MESKNVDEIDYSDGQVELEIFDEIKKTDDVSSSNNIGIEKYSSWPFEYHLSSERANLIRHLNFEGKKVLEIGAGMGALSRYIAERCDFLQIVEGTQQRLNCLTERLRGLNNYSVFRGNFSDFSSAESFDIVLIIGVLEYAEIYYPAGGKNPYMAFVEHASSFLKEDGSLVVAIENKLGLKYWNGAAEDHTGKYFDGISGYSESKSPRTFSKKELDDLLAMSGLQVREFQYPVPDYKIPRSIITDKMASVAPSLFSSLMGGVYAPDHGRERSELFSDALVYQSLNSAGLIAEFANSFLVIANKNSGAANICSDQFLGAHYSHGRRVGTITEFTLNKDEINIRKRLLDNSSDEFDFGPVKWLRPSDESYIEGKGLAHLLRRNLYFHEFSSFEFKWKSFLEEVFERYGCDNDNLIGASWDLLPTNTVVNEDAHFVFFDLEWELKDIFPKSWFVLRSILSFDEVCVTILREKYGSLIEFYSSTCDILGIRPDFMTDFESEMQVQQHISGRQWPESARLAALEKLTSKNRSFLMRSSNFPYGSLKNTIKNFEALKMENESLKYQLTLYNESKLGRLQKKLWSISRKLFFRDR